MRWPAGGWRAARAQPVLWLSLALVCADCITLALYAPALWLFSALAAPVVVGAAAFVEARHARGDTVGVPALYHALLRRHAALLAIGVYTAAIATVAHVALAGLWHALVPGTAGVPLHLLATAFDTVPYVLAGALAWHAPGLVMLRGMTPSAAMLTSLRAAALNWPLLLAMLAVGMALGFLVSLLPATGGTIAALLGGPLLGAVLLMATRGACRAMVGPY